MSSLSHTHMHKCIVLILSKDDGDGDVFCLERVMGGPEDNRGLLLSIILSPYSNFDTGKQYQQVLYSSALWQMLSSGF